MAGHPRNVVFLTADAFGDPAADRAPDRASRRCTTSSRASRPSSRAPRSASPSRSRRSRRASARRSCRSRRPSTRACSARSSTSTARPSGSSTRAGRAARSARATACRSRRRARCSTPRSPAGSTTSTYRADEVFGFEVPVAVPGVDGALLDPRSTWRDPAAYDAKARELAAMFRENFEQVRRRRRADAVAAAGPRPARPADGRYRRRGAPRSSRPSDSFRRWTPRYDVLVVGAGCAGMRAAIEAHDAGARRRRRLEAPPDPQPLRRGRGRDQRGAREQGRGQPRDARLRHGQGLRLPRRPGRDRDLHARGAGRHLPARALGRVFSRNADGRLAQRPFGAAGSPRTVYAADITGHVLDPGALRAAAKRIAQGSSSTRSTSPGSSSSDDGRCQGVICWDLLNGGAEGRRREDRRSSPPAASGRLYRGDDERLRLHGRRDGDGAPRRAAAEGHGVHAVPPDDDVPDRGS